MTMNSYTCTAEYIQISRQSFWLWEFICIEGLHEEAEEFLREHMQDQLPLENEPITLFHPDES